MINTKKEREKKTRAPSLIAAFSIGIFHSATYYTAKEKKHGALIEEKRVGATGT